MLELRCEEGASAANTRRRAATYGILTFYLRMSAVDLSSWTGLAAMCLLTLNVLLGILIESKYNPMRRWPHRWIPIFRIHNWNAYIAVTLVVLHPLILLFSKSAGFRVVDVLWPVHSPGQTLYNCLGAITFYSVLF